MYELGPKSEIFGVDRLQKLSRGMLDADIPVDKDGMPTAMPKLNEGEYIVAGYDQGLGETMIVCESVEDMKELQNDLNQGGALRINWYKGNDPVVITSFSPSKDK